MLQGSHVSRKEYVSRASVCGPFAVSAPMFTKIKVSGALLIKHPSQAFFGAPFVRRSLSPLSRELLPEVSEGFVAPDEPSSPPNSDVRSELLPESPIDEPPSPPRREVRSEELPDDPPSPLRRLVRSKLLPSVLVDEPPSPLRREVRSLLLPEDPPRSPKREPRPLLSVVAADAGAGSGVVPLLGAVGVGVVVLFPELAGRPCAICVIHAAPSVVSSPTYERWAAEMMNSSLQTSSPEAQNVLTLDSG